MRVAGLVGLLLSSFLLPVLPASAQAATYPGVEFVEVVADEADYPAYGAGDILSLAFGEPGDGTLVMRFEVVDLAQTGPEGSELDVYFTTPGGDFQLAVNNDNTHDGFDSATCTAEGNFQYCAVKYETIKVQLGEAITGIFLISFVTLEDDYAPGGLSIEEFAMNFPDPSPTGDPYTITGSTKGGPTGDVDLILVQSTPRNVQVEQGGAAVFELNLTNFGNATQFTLGTTGLPADYSSSFDRVSGPLAQNASAQATLTVDVPSDAVVGLTVPFSVILATPGGFNSNLTLSLTVTEAPDEPTPTDSSTTTSRSTSPRSGTTFLTTQDNLDRTKTPGLEIPLIAALLVGLVFVARRRLGK